MLAAGGTMGHLDIVLLHAEMMEKSGRIVTTSLTLIDIHDIARSARTYGARRVYIAHPHPTMRALANTLQHHWNEGYGATYNENRSEALRYVSVVSSLDEAISASAHEHGTTPQLIATSAKAGGERVSYTTLRKRLAEDQQFHGMLMFGTGWGMAPALLARASIFLEPINGPTPYNHLSVRSAAAISLDRLLGVQ